MPEISVIVPVFNAGKRLVSSINSLLNQTFENLEIIIVNDASTDNSAEIIDRLASDNKNIISIQLSDNLGVHEARLVGIKRASAPWIGFLDSDDFARPSMFKKLYNAAIEQNVDIVVCGSYRVTPDRRIISPKIQFPRNKRIDADIFSRFCEFEFGTGTLWNRLYRKDIIEQWADMHFPWRQRINEDLLLNLGCFYNANSVYLMKDMLHEYVYNELSVTSSIDKTKAYVETYRAYALAVKIFISKGDSVIASIIAMYRRQLTSSPYYIENVSDLRKYDKDLGEAANLILESAPFAFAAILSTNHRYQIISFSFIKKTLRFFFKYFKKI